MHTHTHKHAHQHHQNGTRDEVKKKRGERERQTQKTAHEREIWWLNNEQKIHTNILIQVRRSRETRRKKKMGKAKEKTNKQMIGCFVRRSSMTDLGNPQVMNHFVVGEVVLIVVVVVVEVERQLFVVVLA